MMNNQEGTAYVKIYIISSQRIKHSYFLTCVHLPISVLSTLILIGKSLEFWFKKKKWGGEEGGKIFQASESAHFCHKSAWLVNY